MADSTSPSKTRRFRIGLLVAIAALAVTVVLQNFDPTDMQFLFWQTRAPLAVAIILAMLVGAGLQWLIPMIVQRRRRKQARAAADEAKS